MKDDDDIRRGVDRRIDRLDEAVAARLDRRPHTLPVERTPNHARTRSAFPTGVALSVALVLLVAGGMVGSRPDPQVAPASPITSPLGSTFPSPTATRSPSASLEVITGDVDGSALILQRMGWTCAWMIMAVRALPDLAAIDRAAEEQRVIEGWVDLTLFRRPTRVWIGDAIVAAAQAHGARLLATGTRGDAWILVNRGGIDMAVRLAPHQTPAGRTVWLEGNRSGPCPADDPADALPLDPAIKPVSISEADAEERRAIDMCSMFSVEDVKGMGRIPRARDAYKYVPLTGRTPDLQNDRPAWIVAFEGMLRLPRSGELARDPICVLTELEPGPLLLLPSGTVDHPSAPGNTQQEYRLPPLLP